MPEKRDIQELVLQPGTILKERYLLDKTLMIGEWAVVYIAFDREGQTKVAVKEFFWANWGSSRDEENKCVVKRVAFRDLYEEAFDDFCRNSELLLKLKDCPGIATVRDFFYENNTAYMVMEFIEGIELSHYVKDRGGKLPYAQVIEMMDPVLEGLQRIHEEGIIHQEIWPGNFLVTEDGHAKLMGLCSGRIVYRKNAVALGILNCGYSAIEQYMASEKKGPWTDVYGIAAVMYHLITGIKPPDSIELKIGEKKLEAVHRLEPGTPRALSEAIQKAMIPDRGKRIQDIRKFRLLLKDGKDQGTEHTSIFQRFLKKRKQGRSGS